MKLRISVTKEILEKSKYCSEGSRFKDALGNNCPISIAVKDIFPNAFVSEFGFYPVANSWSDVYEYDGIPIPIEATKFIKSFDRSEPEDRIKMSPISFELNIPEYVINRINISEITELLTNHPTLAIV